MPCLLRKQHTAMQTALIKIQCKTLQKTCAALIECVSATGGWGVYGNVGGRALLKYNLDKAS